MKQPITFISKVLCLCLLAFSSCKSVKVSRGSSANHAPVTTTHCEGTIRYYSDKIISKGEVININSEIVINAPGKIINLKSALNGEKEAFDTFIENYDCSLNATFTEGKATYTGYIKQLDGTTTRAVVKVEVKDGGLTISNGEPGREGDFIMVISKWEMVTE